MGIHIESNTYREKTRKDDLSARCKEIIIINIGEILAKILMQ